MCRTRCVLALMALYVGVAQSWDIAISAGDVIKFYTNGTETDTVRFKSHNLTAIAYNEVHNMILYIDKQTDSDTICGYDLSSMDVTCFIKRNGSNIHGLAFDPVTELLFFTDTIEKSINWISLKTFAPGSRNVVYGNLLLYMNDRTPTNIAVDSCKGYIYWISTDFFEPDRIEKARFNVSEREVLLHFPPHIVFSIAIDQQTQKIYSFFGARHYMTYFFSADLNFENTQAYLADNRYKQTVSTFSKDYIYWINSNENNKTVFQLPKHAIENLGYADIKPLALSYNDKFYSDGRVGIAANYKIKDQIQGIQDCEAPTSPVPNNFDGWFCVHGMKVSGQSVCKCAPGYIGKRCDVSVCENYCLQGNCSVKDKGLPKCSCNAGYSGERCEVNVCFNYCLNDGNSFLDEQDAPVCQCVGKHKGSRYEAVSNNTVTFTNTPTYYSAERNLTLVDLLSHWRKPTAKITVTVEV